MRNRSKMFAILSCLMVSLATGNIYAGLQSSIGISNSGSVANDMNTHYAYRIADFMADILSVNMDNEVYADAWQQALNDLTAAATNGEITHVQLRTFWRMPRLNLDNPADSSDPTVWNEVEPGAYDGNQQYPGQQPVCDNWRRWVFGSPAPTYTCAAKRIHDAGLNIEFHLGTAWIPGFSTVADSVPPLHNQPEANYPTFNGETLLSNYWNNVLKPTAEFLAASPNFVNGDIFCINAEMCYCYTTFWYSHNAAWATMIDSVRDIFNNAGKSGILLTMHCNSFWDDVGLGYDGLQLLIANGLAVNNPIASSFKGFTGATSFLSHLDFITIAFWLGPLTQAESPTVWSGSEDEIAWVAGRFRDNRNRYKAGTGHGTVPGEFGRDFLNDFWAISQLTGKPILTNSGFPNTNLALYNPLSYSGTRDANAQKVAWAAQIRAYGSQSWCCGQDFERYCHDKAAKPTRVDHSWRKALAEAAIIQEIRNVSS